MDKDQLCIDLANLSFYDFECVLGRRIKKKEEKKNSLQTWISMESLY